MITTAEDFRIKPFFIPSDQDLGNALQSFINGEEERELRKLFGSLFYNALVIGISALPAKWVSTTAYTTGQSVRVGSVKYTALSNNTGTNPVSSPLVWEVQPDDRWLKLLEGDTYIYGGFKYNWIGLRVTCIPMISCRYDLDFQQFNTNVGAAKATSENSIPASVRVTASRAWRTYRKFVYLGEAMYCNNPKETLLGYLYASASEFDDLVVDTGYGNFLNYFLQNFLPPQSINAFDL